MSAFSGLPLVIEPADLATRLQADGKTVVGFGERKTPPPFVNACSKFLYLDREENQPEANSDNIVSVKKWNANELKGDAKLVTLLRNAVYYEQARAFGRLVAEYSQRCEHKDRIFVCTGGGPGIMEAANRGAHDAGAPNVGLNIYLPHEQHGNPYITPGLSFKFHYFALRKMHFMMRAKALVAFPGGFGTMDELFEVLTLVQTHKSKPVPVILFGTEFWKRVLNFDVLVEEGTISAKDLNLFRYTDDPAEAWSFIQQFYQSGWNNG